MTATALDVNRTAKAILRETKHEFKTAPPLEDAMDVEDLIPLVQARLIDEKKTTTDEGVCVENLLRRVLGKYRNKEFSIQEIDRDGFFWTQSGNKKDADFAGLPNCGKDVAQDILSARVLAERPATKADIVNTIVHELKKNDRELSKADVKAVLGELKKMIANHLSKQGPGKFTIPDLCEIKVVVDRSGSDPETDVMVVALKGLKNMAKT